MSNFSFPRPSDPAPVQAREAVAGHCPECPQTYASLMRRTGPRRDHFSRPTECRQCWHLTAGVAAWADERHR